MQVRVPSVMIPKYQNLSIATIGVNTPTEQILGKIIQDKNNNNEDNHTGLSDDADETVTVANFPSACVDDIKSAILEYNC